MKDLLLLFSVKVVAGGRCKHEITSKALYESFHSSVIVVGYDCLIVIPPKLEIRKVNQ